MMCYHCYARLVAHATQHHPGHWCHFHIFTWGMRLWLTPHYHRDHMHSHDILTIRDVVGQSRALLEAPVIPGHQVHMQELYHRGPDLYIERE